MTDQPSKVLDTQIRDAIREEVRAAVTEALADVPRTETVKQMITQQVSTGLAGLNSIIDARFETYTRESIDPILRDVQQSLKVFQGIGPEINDLKIAIAGFQGRIDQMLTGFQDMRTRQERLDNEHEEDRQLMGKQNERLTKVEAANQEMRRDIFGTTDPNGPPSMMQVVQEGFHNLQVSVETKHLALTDRLDTQDQQIAINTAWIASRRKVEQFVAQGVKKLSGGVGGVLKSKLLWYTLIGGGLGGVALYLLDQLGMP